MELKTEVLLERMRLSVEDEEEKVTWFSVYMA
jgi:hypothetical protein